MGEQQSELPSLAMRRARLALQQGGLGLRSAELLAPAAYWASWADALPILNSRLPPLTERMVRELEAGVNGVAASL